MTRAFAYADGREAGTGHGDSGAGSTGRRRSAGLADADANSGTASWAARERAAAAAPAMDPVLHDIYSKETSSHLTEIREYLRKRTGQPAPHELPESVYRAIHTLSGSSKMAEARHGIRITEPLNRSCARSSTAGMG